MSTSSPVTEVEPAIEVAAEERRNWRKWGPDDQAGTLCFVEQTIVTAAPVKLCVFHNGNELEVGDDAGAEG
jgi:hypothetical protein